MSAVVWTRRPNRGPKGGVQTAVEVCFVDDVALGVITWTDGVETEAQIEAKRRINLEAVLTRAMKQVLAIRTALGMAPMVDPYAHEAHEVDDLVTELAEANKSLRIARTLNDGLQADLAKVRGELQRAHETIGSENV